MINAKEINKLFTLKETAGIIKPEISVLAQNQFSADTYVCFYAFFLFLKGECPGGIG